MMLYAILTCAYVSGSPLPMNCSIMSLKAFSQKAECQQALKKLRDMKVSGLEGSEYPSDSQAAIRHTDCYVAPTWNRPG
jgi:hypothetical protein